MISAYAAASIKHPLDVRFHVVKLHFTNLFLCNKVKKLPERLPFQFIILSIKKLRAPNGVKIRPSRQFCKLI
jgi:hypothetical protein